MKSLRKTQGHLDIRRTLVGNGWSVPAVAWIVGQLLAPLGFTDSFSPQDIMNSLNPTKTLDVRSRLLRRPLAAVKDKPTAQTNAPEKLVSLLSRLVSVKGEDILLNFGSDQIGSYQRLRQTVPARLWRWRVISGWQWTKGKEHINALELRALEATLRWRIIKLGDFHCKAVHLTDSLVCLHAVSRGRSSSRKLRGCICRLNAVLLATGVSPIWGYVRTDQNPADKPSRWKVRAKFRKCPG